MDNVDYKYLKDYMRPLQQKLYERYGVKFNLGDLRVLMTFPMKNILLAMMRHEEVFIYNRFFMSRRKKGLGKPTLNPSPSPSEHNTSKEG